MPPTPPPKDPVPRPVSRIPVPTRQPPAAITTTHPQAPTRATSRIPVSKTSIPTANPEKSRTPLSEPFRKGLTGCPNPIRPIPIRNKPVSRILFPTAYASTHATTNTTPSRIPRRTISHSPAPAPRPSPIEPRPAPKTSLSSTCRIQSENTPPKDLKASKSYDPLHPPVFLAPARLYHKPALDSDPEASVQEPWCRDLRLPMLGMEAPRSVFSGGFDGVEGYGETREHIKRYNRLERLGLRLMRRFRKSFVRGGTKERI